MPETIAPAAGAVAPVVPPTAAPAQPPAAPANPANPDWLPERLAQAKRSGQSELLAELGVTDLEAAKTAVKAAKAAEDATKSAEQRAAEASTRLASTEAERARLHAVTSEHAGRMLGVLSPERQAAVKQIAGDNPSEQLRVIGALAASWSEQDKAAAVVAPTTTTTPVAPTTQAPATTAPPPVAPNGQTVTPPNHSVVYQQLRSSNPFEAAIYAQQNTGAYDTK